MIVTDYLFPAFDKETQKTVVDKATKIIESLENLNEYSLVGTGMSGTLLLPLLSYLTGINYTIVRKSSDKRHTRRDVEGYLGFTRYIIVDDLISSGQTIEAIKLSISSSMSDAKLEGIILYNTYENGDLIYWEKRFECWIKKVLSPSEPEKQFNFNIPYKVDNTLESYRPIWPKSWTATFNV